MAEVNERATCRSCGARIIWARTAGDRTMPVDEAPDALRGNLLITDLNGKHFVEVVAGPDLAQHRLRLAHKVAGTAPLYVSHFATCPGAAKHRKKP